MGVLTPEQLDEAAAKDAVSTYIRVKARDYHRRQMNRVWPQIKAQIDMALSTGQALDLPALLREIWEKDNLPAMIEGSE